PERHCLDERAKPRRRVAQISFEQALELEEGLVIEADIFEIARLELRLAQTIFDRMRRKIPIVLLAGEALLLRRRDDLAVDHDRCRRIVIEGGNAQDRRHESTELKFGARGSAPDATAAWACRDDRASTETTRNTYHDHSTTPIASRSGARHFPLLAARLL